LKISFSPPLDVLIKVAIVFLNIFKKLV
jgi:hypothetical protein